MNQVHRLSRNWIGIFLLAIAAAVIGFLFVFQSIREARRRGYQDHHDEVRFLMKMREIYPIVPLGKRLPKPVITSTEMSNVQISDDAERELKAYEEAEIQTVTHYRLRRLHEEKLGQFVKENGFGVNRMWFGISSESPNFTAPSPDQVALDDSPADAGTEQAVSRTEFSPADLLSLPVLHNEAFYDFVLPWRRGVVVPNWKALSKTVKSMDSSNQATQDWSRLPDDSPLHPLSVGHTEHGMSAAVKASFEKRLTDWQLSRLELVSLLKSPQPRAYLSRNLPNMRELDAAPTRALDQFETDNLQKLRMGEHVVIESNNAEIRMLGGIRAANQCVACHVVQRGYLLGAFTYTLRRAHSTTATSAAAIDH